MIGRLKSSYIPTLAFKRSLVRQAMSRVERNPVFRGNPQNLVVGEPPHGNAGQSKINARSEEWSNSAPGPLFRNDLSSKSREFGRFRKPAVVFLSI
jgi:hypothetical protein